MPMQAMTTMTLLGTLNTGAMSPVAVHASIASTGHAATSAKEQTHFAETMAKAGVPAPPAFSADVKTPAFAGTAEVFDFAKTSPSQTMPALANRTQTMATQTAQANVMRTVPTVDEIAQHVAAQSMQPKTMQSLATSTVKAEIVPSVPAIVDGAQPAMVQTVQPKIVKPVPGSAAVEITQPLAAKTVEPNIMRPVTDAIETAQPLTAQTTITQPVDVVTAQVPQAVSALPAQERTTLEPQARAGATETPVPLAVPPPATPSHVVSPVALEATAKPGRKVLTAVAVETRTDKPTKEFKGHGVVASTPLKETTATPTFETNAVVPLIIASPLAQQPVPQDSGHDAKELVGTPSTVAVPMKAGSVDTAKPASVPVVAASISRVVPQMDEPAIEPEPAPQALVVEHAEQPEVPTVPVAIVTAPAMQKSIREATKSASPKHVHEIVTNSPAPTTSNPSTAFPVAPTPASQPLHAPIPDAGIVVASVAHAAMVAAPLIPATQEVTTHGPQKMEHPSGSTPVQSVDSLDLPQSAFGHTTLSASPTVLEVGVPGGSHGWLKIRAEIGEGGAVQASLSAATHAGHETLRRELPQMTAFLVGEQVAVQLHVPDRPQGSPSSASFDRDLTQAATSGERGGSEGEDHTQQEPASSPSFVDGPESAWASSDYGTPTALHGGSWVNVVA
jgi:hypothetical protein